MCVNEKELLNKQGYSLYTRNSTYLSNHFLVAHCMTLTSSLRALKPLRVP